jgi:hypothetical protein
MRWAGLLILVSFLGACTTAPMGPSIMVLPGRGIAFEQFQADDAACREWASRQAGSPEQQLQYDIAYQQCMYSKGHVIPGVQPLHRGGSLTVQPSALR